MKAFLAFMMEIIADDVALRDFFQKGLNCELRNCFAITIIVLSFQSLDEAFLSLKSHISILKLFIKL